MADFRFNVSDSYLIPRRGWLLRLKLVEGDFDPSMLKPGKAFRLMGPNGEDRKVTVKGLSVTGGRQTRQRVERFREFDLVIPPEQAVVDGQEVGIGWKAVPV
ncbi:MAG: hypothetical protein ACLFRX_01990 [Gemmatimonadota bacterium]